VVLPRMLTDIVPVFQACCEGRLNEIDIAYSQRPCVTVVMASGGYPKEYEKGKEITGIDAAETLDDVIVFHAGTKQDGDKLRTNGGRVLNVTALGDDLPATIDRAYDAVKKIHFDAAHYRNDIGKKALDRLG
jgi:phosphoribosylamine---glycine ligase